MKNLTIHKLRKDFGFKCRIIHKRYVKSNGLVSLFDIRQKGLQPLIESKGGFSSLSVTTPQGKDYSVETFCSRADSFNRKISLQILIGRLAKQLKENELSSLS